MFFYVRNRHNPSPRYSLWRDDPGGSVRFVDYLRAPVLVLPDTVEELRSRRTGKFWANIKRRERLFDHEVGPLEFHLLTDPFEIRPWLRRVHSLFVRRWGRTYTSSPWMSDDGFTKYAEALVDLASTGEASLAILQCREQLLSFGYNLVEGRVVHMFQHASDDRPEYRRYGLGTIFLARLLQNLVAERRHRVFDFMVGEQAYKVGWATCVQNVYLRVDRREYRHVLAFYAAWLASRARVRVMKSGRWKRMLKRVIRIAATRPLRTPAPRSALRPAGPRP